MKATDICDMIKKFDRRQIILILKIIEDYIISGSITIEFSMRDVKIGVRDKPAQDILEKFDVDDSQFIRILSSFTMYCLGFLKNTYNYQRHSTGKTREREFSEEEIEKLSFLESELLKRKTILSFLFEAQMGWGYTIADIDYSFELKTIDTKDKTTFIPSSYLTLRLFNLKESKYELMKIHLTQERFSQLFNTLKEFEDKLNQTLKRIEEFEVKINKE